MTEKTTESVSADTNDGQSILRKAIIAFAIIEALVLIPIVLRMIFR